MAAPPDNSLLTPGPSVEAAQALVEGQQEAGGGCMRARAWNSESESSLVPRAKRAFTLQVPRLLCQTSRRPLCLPR